MDNEYRRAANITIIIAGIAAGAYLIFKYALGAAIPFIIAFAISALISPLAKKISEKTKISYRLLSAVLVTLLFLAVAAIISFAVYRLMSEVGRLLDRLTAEPETVSHAIESLISRLQGAGERLGFLKQLSSSEALTRLGLDLDALLPEALRSLMSSLTGSIPSAAVGLASKLPEALLFVVVLLLSSYYFCVDRAQLSAALRAILPDRWAKKLPAIREKLIDTIRGYLKAYLSIMLLTFFEVFIGLTLLGVDYAFLLGITIAVVDILPVLGTGTVLIPWAIFSFICSDPKMGVGLLILYAVVLVVRQFVEPRIVGNTLGLHPLATLASIYVGIKLLGFGGIFIGPVVAILLCHIFKSDSPVPTESPEKSDTP